MSPPVSFASVTKSVVVGTAAVFVAFVCDTFVRSVPGDSHLGALGTVEIFGLVLELMFVATCATTGAFLVAWLRAFSPISSRLSWTLYGAAAFALTFPVWALFLWVPKVTEFLYLSVIGAVGGAAALYTLHGRLRAV